MMPRVYSRRVGADPAPASAVYVGRPTSWGNQFAVQIPGDHEEHAAAVQRYEEWIWDPAQEDRRERARQELVGRDLLCWCQSPSDENPLPCHATVLLKIANEVRS